METITTNSALPAWAHAAIAEIERDLDGFRPPLSDRLSRIRARITNGNGAESTAGALSAASASPLFALLEALRIDYGLSAADPRFCRLGTASLWFYFYLRLQDDLVDEPERFDPAFVYILQIFSDNAHQAFAEALAQPADFFAFQARTMAEFAEVALWEVDTVRQGGFEAVEILRVGRKFLPGAVPLGALALLVGKPADLASLTGFAVSMGTGLQFVNDILNVQEDHRSGRLTPVLSWLYENGKVEPGCDGREIRLVMATDPALERAGQVASNAFSEAASLAEAIDAPHLAAIAGQRIEFLESLPYRLLSLHLGAPEL